VEAPGYGGGREAGEIFEKVGTSIALKRIDKNGPVFTG